MFNGYDRGGFATLDLTNCTLSGNSTQHRGGGIVNRGRDEYPGRGVTRVAVNDCTLSGNSAAEGGDSIWNEMNLDDTPPVPPPSPCPGCPPPPPPPPPSQAIIEVVNTILNVEVPGNNIQNISPGTITSHGYNLCSDAAGGDGSTGPGGFLNAIGDIRNTNPFLGPLQDNGGPTLTHALLFYSPAIHAGDPNFNPYAFTPPLLFDQRSLLAFPRVVNGRIDIGAYELKYP